MGGAPEPASPSCDGRATVACAPCVGSNEKASVNATVSVIVRRRNKPPPLVIPPTSALGRRSLSSAVRYARSVLGEQEAVVMEIRPWDVHGVGHVDVTLVYPDRTVETARLGRESVAEGLVAGDMVLVAKAMNVVVEVRRAGA